MAASSEAMAPPSPSNKTRGQGEAPDLSRRIVLEFSPERVDEIDSMKVKLKMTTRKEMFNYAIGLLEWAIRQREKGNVIMVGNHDTGKYIEISMPALDSIEPVQPDALLSPLQSA